MLSFVFVYKLSDCGFESRCRYCFVFIKNSLDFVDNNQNESGVNCSNDNEFDYEIHFVILIMNAITSTMKLF